jgi:hypothetical protein
MEAVIGVNGNALSVMHSQSTMREECLLLDTRHNGLYDPDGGAKRRSASESSISDWVPLRK